MDPSIVLEMWASCRISWSYLPCMLLNQLSRLPHLLLSVEEIAVQVLNNTNGTETFLSLPGLSRTTDPSNMILAYHIYLRSSLLPSVLQITFLLRIPMYAWPKHQMSASGSCPQSRIIRNSSPSPAGCVEIGSTHPSLGGCRSNSLPRCLLVLHASHHLTIHIGHHQRPNQMIDKTASYHIALVVLQR